MTISDSEVQITLIAETESTNALALSAIDDGAAEGTAFVADAQSAGRGRREAGGRRRQWFSPAGKNLYLSVVVRPVIALEKSAALTLAVGAQVVELLRTSTAVDVQLKWPNDLYVDGKKLGGILTEGVTGREGLDAVVVGLGLNVNVADDEFPGELRPIATSLCEQTGERHDRMSLALKICQAIVEASTVYADRGLAAFDERLQKWDYLRGRAVEVDADSGSRSGVARGIGLGGGLKVEFEDGQVREMISGEVTLKKGMDQT